MKIQTSGIRHAEQLYGTKDWHVISIRSRDGRMADLQGDWGFVTFVELYDGAEVPAPLELAKVVTAVERAHRMGANLYIHCEMGVSRSVGVAYAAAEVFNAEYRSVHYGNSTIKMAVVRALREREERNAP